VDNRKSRLNNISLTAFPNPFSHETQIQVSGQRTDPAKLVLLDIQGRRIKEIELFHSSSYQLFREKLPSGIYMLQLIDSEQSVTSLKLVVQ